jgi:hypothetical protein
LSGGSTPEEAARGDIPEDRVRALGVELSPRGKDAIVLMELNDRSPVELFEMACVRTRSRWMPMAGSAQPGETSFRDVGVRTFWDEAPNGSRTLRVEWLRVPFRDRLRRRLLASKISFWLLRRRGKTTEFELQPIGGPFAATLVERGGLVAPAELRGPVGDAFAHEYFVAGETAFIAGLTTAEKDSLEIEATVEWVRDADERFQAYSQRIAERILDRFREWQETATQ